MTFRILLANLLPSAYNKWDWDRLRWGAENFIQGSHKGGRDPITYTISYFPSMFILAGS